MISFKVEAVEMKTELVFWCASQRSGTHALASALTKTGDFYYFDEVFHTSQRHFPGNFLTFVEENRISGWMSSNTDAFRLLRRYFNHLQDLAGTRFAIVDIKYNSWLNLTPPWWYASEGPFILNVLRQRNAKVLHITRDDVLGIVLSMAVAEQTGHWHRFASESGTTTAQATRPFEVDIAKVRHLCAKIARSRVYFSSLLKDYPNGLDVAYESLFQDGQFTGLARLQLGEFFGADISEVAVTDVIRNRPNYRHLIKNLAAVEAEVMKVDGNIAS